MSNQVELYLTRTFKAPKALVFQVCTEPEHLQHWWAPKGFTMSCKKLELRPGGTFLYSQTSPEGHTMWGKFVYNEIVSPEKLVFVSSFTDTEGNTVRAPFSETWPLEILNNWKLAEEDGETTLIIRGGPINATEAELQMYAGAEPMMRAGFEGTFAALEAYLAQLQ